MTCGIFGDLSDPGELLRGGHGQRTHDRLMKTVNQTCALVGDNADLTTLAGLEPHSGSRGDVQAASAGKLSVKAQSHVGFREVIMTPDLDRPVACIDDTKGNCGRVRIAGDLARCGKNLARYHVRLRSAPAHRER